MGGNTGCLSDPGLPDLCDEAADSGLSVDPGLISALEPGLGAKFPDGFERFFEAEPDINSSLSRVSCGR